MSVHSMLLASHKRGVFVDEGAIIGSISGLYGKRYNGYFNDSMSWFDTATLHGDTNTATSLNGFSSSADNYSWMWLGYFKASTTETYTFYTDSDDASYVWIGSNAISGYTAGNATVNNGGLHGSQERNGTVSLTAGTYYPMRVMFGENGGGDFVTVSFSTPTISKTTNGSGYYFGGTYAWSTNFGSSGTPVWSTSSGSLGSDYTQRTSSFTVSATGATSYSVVSGSLPTGHSLNTSTGVISGTASGVSDFTSSTYSFTIRATNSSGTSDRAFSITIASRYVGYRCSTASEGGTCSDTAPTGYVFNRVDFCSYGTPNGSCGSFTIGGCNSTASNSYNPTPCSSYSIGMNNGQWGDPCNGTYKRGYVQMSYGPF